MTGNYKPGYAFVFLLRVRLIAYIYPLLPSIHTQNRDIIDWYITEPTIHDSTAYRRPVFGSGPDIDSD
jgi:hypothetical protein